MPKSLVIVESPTKVKTISRYLGNDYVVKSSVGHIRDLPQSGGGKAAPPASKGGSRRATTDEEKAAKAYLALVRRMGVDPENGWEAHYEIVPGKEKVIKDLRAAAARAEAIYLATDLDREGEAIAWHLREVIGGDEGRYHRVTFPEITKAAIKSAFADPGSLNRDRIDAQQARRFLDRVVGFMVSPLLWKKIARGLSAGRVQSVALRLVVEREREIKAFVPEEYWQLHVRMTSDGGPVFTAEVVKEDGKRFRPTSAAETDAAMEVFRKRDGKIVQVESKPVRSRPYPPLITSTLQQAASSRLGFGVKKTMIMAQRLYEAGYITYMRTDSTALSNDAIGACRGWIEKNYGKDYLPEKPRRYASAAAAQEAHEAIRPSDVRSRGEDLRGVDADAKRLYDLIWRQFVACQMPEAVHDTTTATIEVGPYELRARGRVLRFDGWLKVMPPAKKKDDDQAELPPLEEGKPVEPQELLPSQHFTKPPPRYSEASLVKEMTKRGIGRPSTYASIISTIQDRGYVRLENRRLYAEKIGEIVSDRLLRNFSELMDYEFTSNLEEKLDEIAEGEIDWKKVLDEFYAEFKGDLERADERMLPNDPTPTDIECPECGRPMQVRTASTGVFLGCSGYSLPPKERCRSTINLVPGDEVVEVTDGDDDGTEAETRALRKRRRCRECGTAMDAYLVDERRKLHVCGRNPECPGIEIEEGKFKIKGYEGPTLECDKCGAEMQLRSGRFGKYFACTAKDCKNTRKLLRSGEPAPPKADPVPMPELPCEKSDGHFILRDGAAGIFLASSRYPRSRETRNPLVEDLVRHRDELDPKFAYLTEAPTEDPAGNKAVIRFSRKTKQQYVATEVDGKPTGWTAFHEKGRWVERGEPKEPGSKKKKAAKKSGAGKKKSAKKSSGKKKQSAKKSATAKKKAG